MGSAAWLNCTGLDDLDAKTHSEVVVRPRRVLEPLCKDAGKTLTITKGDHRGDLNLDFDSDTDTRALCPRQSARRGRRRGGARAGSPGHARLRPGRPVDQHARNAPLPERVLVARPGPG